MLLALVYPMTGNYNNGVTVELAPSDLIGLKGNPKLSLYLKNDPKFIAAGLPTFLKTARKILLNAPMAPLEVDLLMGPLEDLVDALPKNWHGETLAVFRDEARFSIIPLLAEVPPRIVVASSFHIKPLLAEETRVARGDLLYVRGDEAALHHMYHGRSKLIGEWSVKEGTPSRVAEHLGQCQGPLVMFTDSAPLKLNTFSRRVILNYEDTSLEGALRGYWRLTRSEEDERLSREIDMVLVHPERIMAKTATELAAQLKRRAPKKLFITLEDMAWGEWDESVGVVAVHRCQSNHRDDDLFDDIAESELRRGTNVRVVPRKLMPIGVTALAL